MARSTAAIVFGVLFVVGLTNSFKLKPTHPISVHPDSLPQDVAPGYKTTITPAGLDYLEKVGIEMLQEKIKTITIPNQSGDADTPIGHVDWTLTDIKVVSLSIGSDSIFLNPGSGVGININGLSLDFTSSWSYRKNHWPHVSDHGTADIIASGVTVVVDIRVSETNGELQVAVTSDAVSVGGLDIKLHGGASWLYNFFLHILDSNVKKLVQSELTTVITQSVNDGLNKALSTFPMIQKVNNDIEIDVHLVAQPVFTANYASLPQKGEFYDIHNPTECPSQTCAPSSFPDVVNSKMVQMFMGQYMMNSGAFVYNQLGKLNQMVTDADVPSDAPIRLNTTYWKYLIPQMYQMWPNNLMELHVKATSVPSITLTPNGAVVNTVGTIDVYVVETNGTLTYVFELSGTVVTGATALLSTSKIYANVTYQSSTFTLVESDIGQINMQVMNNLIMMMLQDGIIPDINFYLAEGMVLPTVQGVTFVNPTIIFANGYLVVATDITYTPPTGDEEPSPVAPRPSSSNAIHIA